MRYTILTSALMFLILAAVAQGCPNREPSTIPAQLHAVGSGDVQTILRCVPWCGRQGRWPCSVKPKLAPRT